MPLTLNLWPERYTVWQLPADASPPAYRADARFTCIIHTAHEISGVCVADAVPAGALTQPDWRCFEFVGPFDLALTGIMVQVALPLAQAGVPIFTLATYNTDFLLIPADHITTACDALTQAGIHINTVT